MTHGRWVARTFAPLRNRPFRLYWVGKSVSFLGNAVATVALTLAVIAMTGSASALGAVLGTMAAAQVASTLAGGVLADRLPRKHVIMAADSVRAISQVIVAVELFSGRPSIAMLAIASGFAGAALGCYLPAIRGIVPAVVPDDLLQTSNSLLALSKRTTMMLGPVLATTMVLTVGAGWALLLDAATFVINLCIVATLRVDHVPRNPTTFLADLAEGWREVRSRTWLWSNLIVFGVWNFVRCVYFTVGPMVVIQEVGGELGWATVVQGGAIGALVGAFAVMHIRPRRPLVVINLLTTLGMLPLIAIAFEAPVIVIAVATALMSLVLGMNVIWETTLQRHIPPEVISRVFSYDWLVSLSLNPLGMACAGPIAMAVGAEATLLASAVAIGAVSVGALASRQVRELGPHPVSPRPAATAVAGSPG